MQRLAVRFLVALSTVIFWATQSKALDDADPHDSVIVESKTVAAGVGHPRAVVKVYITNKDTLAGYVICLKEQSVTGGAYMKLAWPRTFNGVITPLTTTLRTWTILNTSKYNSVSPDTFMVVGILDITNKPATFEPPNTARKALFEIKFDTVLTSAGSVSFDAASIIYPWSNNVTSFVDIHKNDLAVNFKKGTVNVVIGAQAQSLWDLNFDGVLNAADLVLLLNCVFLGEGNCREGLSPSDVVALLNALYKEEN